MGRYKLKDSEVRKSFGASAKNEVIELLGKMKCKEIAENAVEKEYLKAIKK